MTEEEVVAEAAHEEAEAWDDLAWRILSREDAYEERREYYV